MLLDSFLENAQQTAGAKIMVESAEEPSVLDEVTFTPLDKYVGIGEGFADAINSMNANYSSMMLGVAYMESVAYRKNATNVIERVFSEATSLEEARNMLTAGDAFEMVFEASDAKTLKEGVVAWFKKAWEKLQAAFKNAIDKIAGLINNTDQILANYKAALANDKGLANKVVGSVTLISVGTKNYGKDFPNYTAKIAEGFRDVIKGLEADREYNKLANSKTIKDVAGYDQWLSAHEDKAIKGFGEEDKKKYFARVEGMQITAGQAANALEASKSRLKAAIEAAQNEAKGVYDQAIKDLEAISASTGTDSHTAQKAQQYISKKISYHKAMATVIAQASREACVAANHNYSTYLGAMRAAIGGSKSGAKDTSALKDKEKDAKAGLLSSKEDKAKAKEAKQRRENVNASAGLAALMVD